MKYSIELIGTGLEIVVGKISTQSYKDEQKDPEKFKQTIIRIK